MKQLFFYKDYPKFPLHHREANDINSIEIVVLARYRRHCSMIDRDPFLAMRDY